MFETISLLGNAAVNLSDKCVKGITVNREICERYVFNSIGLVTYLNPYIGHHNGDLVGKICAQTGKGVREVVLERGLLSEEELNRILSPENLMNPICNVADKCRLKQGCCFRRHFIISISRIICRTVP